MISGFFSLAGVGSYILNVYSELPALLAGVSYLAWLR